MRSARRRAISCCCTAGGNRALDRGREAVLEHFEDDPRRCRTDAVNARQDAGDRADRAAAVRVGDRRRRALVAPAALGRALDPGEVAKRGADLPLMSMRGPAQVSSANHAGTNELAGQSWTRFVTDAKLESGVAAQALRFVPRHARRRRARSDHVHPWFRRCGDGAGLVHRATPRCEVAIRAARNVRSRGRRAAAARLTSVSIPHQTRRRRQFWTRPGASSPISACRSTASGSTCTVTAAIAWRHTTTTCTTFAKGSRSHFFHWARRGG